MTTLALVFLFDETGNLFVYPLIAAAIADIILPLLPPWVNMLGYPLILGLDEQEEGATDWGLIVDWVATGL